MKALITGGGGFCGRHLSDFLIGQDVEVHTIGTRKRENPNHHRISDITSIGELSEIVRKVKPGYIFHLAGISQTTDPIEYYHVNTQYAVALLSAIESTGITDSPVLLAGTSAEYGKVTSGQLPIKEETVPKPYSHYGISKLSQTLQGLAASHKNIPVVIARPFNIIGPGMPPHLVVQSFATQIVRISNKQDIPVIHTGNLESSRDFIDVSDLVKIFWDLIRMPSAMGEVVNVCTGEGILIRQILEKLIEWSGESIEVSQDSKRMKGIEIDIHYGSTWKMEQLLGYRVSLNLEKSLNRVLNHLQNLS